MKLIELFNNQIINEGANTPLIVVDLQPDYDGFGQENFMHTKKFVEFIHKQKNIIWFFNGDDYTNDNKKTIQHWLIEEFGIDEDVVENISFREKGYGFFREWMDAGIDPKVIIKIIRAMIVNRTNYSSDLDLSLLLDEEDFEEVSNLGDIVIPDIAIGELKRLSGAYICGGAKSECFREITLLLNALNIKYKEVSEFIYGD
jgi:hypothetical protein